MNLVSGYGSSSDEDEPQATPDLTRVPHVSASSPASLAQQTCPPASAGGKGDAVAKVRLSDTAASSAGKSKKRKLKSKDGKGSKKNTRASSSRKKVNALILSPEIQAALARRVALSESDSDDDTSLGTKDSKAARPPADPSDLLSLLPQPKAATMAEDALLKSKQRRDLKAKQVKAGAEGDSASSNSKETLPKASAEVLSDKTRKGPESRAGGQQSSAATVSAVVEENDGKDPSEDDDSEEEDLLAKMHEQQSKARSETAGLFTLPSRSKPKLESFTPVPDILSSTPATSGSAVETGDVGSGATLAVSSGSEAWQVEHPHGKYRIAGNSGEQLAAAGGEYMAGGGEAAPGHWTGLEAGAQREGYWRDAGDGMHALGETREGESSGLQHVGHSQGVSQPYAFPGGQPQSGQAGSSSASGFMARGGGAGESGAGGGGKASRRRGRDMERALASGDLGALGDETLVMDLHQGSNEYVPARSKPMTAAMQQDKKHIEGSVYDPRTGQTVKTLEPTSLQRRKHQINQLAVQAANMERDLLERGSASRLTKAQTQAKYGW